MLNNRITEQPTVMPSLHGHILRHRVQLLKVMVVGVLLWDSGMR